MVKKEKDRQNGITVIGIGASAGGLEALQEFLGNFHFPDLNVAIVIAQHLSPSYKSMLVQLLGRATRLEVVEVHNGIAVESGRVYITPPDSEISIKNNLLYLNKPSVGAGPKPSIDVFFQSLANDKRENAVGVILSGTGSDGANGIRAIKDVGGFTIAQEPQTAKYDGMPLAAIHTEKVDVVLSPDKMGEEIRDFLVNPRVAISSPGEIPETGSMNRLFNLLSKRTQTDFSNYKISTICRRLEKRLAKLRIGNIEDYLEYVDGNPRELDQLFQMILIGVTQFFRDVEAYRELEKYIKQIIRQKPANEPIRIWVPGCATGEEPYSLAILFARILGNDIKDYNIQIFATDIDEKAINFARKALYPVISINELPSEVVKKYFEKKPNDQYELVKSIRQMVLFSKHDVTINPPFLKLDLISCRNLLIYFNLNLQKHVIPIFHYSLNPGGILFLGKSETVGQFADLFSTLDGKFKIFKRKGGANANSIRFVSFKPKTQTSSQGGQAKDNSRMTITEMVKETFFNTFEHPYVVINDTMDIREIYGDVRLYLSLSEGTMNANILKLIHRDLQIDLRSLLTRAINDRAVVKGKPKRISFFGNDHFVRITIKPLLYTKPDSELYLVVFERIDMEEGYPKLSVTDQVKENPLIAELEHELQATREHLQTYVEELETSNEELQALNEELQSANEELQSTNEELETSNEELQSTNEELQIAYSELRTANDNLREKESAIQDIEANNQALLSNTLQISAMINADLGLIAFNNGFKGFIKRIAGREPKTGENIIKYYGKDETREFLLDIKTVIDGNPLEKEIKIAANKCVRWYHCYYAPVFNSAKQVSGAVLNLLDITGEKSSRMKLEKLSRQLNLAFSGARLAWWDMEVDSGHLDLSPLKAEMLGYSPDEFPDDVKGIMELVHPDDNEQTMNDMRTCLKGEKQFYESTYRIRTRNGDYKWFYDRGMITAKNDKGKPTHVSGITYDVTAQKQLENFRDISLGNIQKMFDHITDYLVVITIDGVIKYYNQAFADFTGLQSGNSDVSRFFTTSDTAKISKIVKGLEVDGFASIESAVKQKDGKKQKTKMMITRNQWADQDTVSFVIDNPNRST